MGGKTAEGAVWLDESKFSITNFWQYWRNTSDNDVIKFLKLFTEIEISEIKRFKNFTGAELNKLKIILANEVTALCHGLEKSKRIATESNNIRKSDQIDYE